MKSKHDKIVERIASKLRNKFPDADIYTNHVYDTGEIDVLLINGGHSQVYEVKSSGGHKNKALNQLNRARGHLRRRYNITDPELYYVFGSKNSESFDIEEI